jgi:hypothetical protein
MTRNNRTCPVFRSNLRRPAPSPEFVEAITTDPDLETIFVNMHAAGVAVTLKKH